MIDLIVVGSGPSGAQAAAQAIESGLSVTLVDFGNDSTAQDAVPMASFTELREQDPNQRDYFLGDGFRDEVSRNDRLGAHFTAPRDFVTRDVASLLPVESSTFFPVQSLALGGLGAGWGAGAPTFEPFELDLAGLPADAMAHYYASVARDVGISGASDDDTAPQVLRIPNAQPPAQIDSNADSLLAAYRMRRTELLQRRFSLGRAPLAMLTRDLAREGVPRFANPYNDMDFYGNSAMSVYRPKYTILELSRKPAFAYVSGALVEAFSEEHDCVRVSYMERSSGLRAELRGRALVIASGAINSARIVARSLGLYDLRLPLLCNPMHYIPCINLAMLGRAARDRRHSLAQLLAIFSPPHRHGGHVMAAIYSYRSLLHYRLVKDIPLPPYLGLLVSRALMNSLTLVGVHHPEGFGSSKWLALHKGMAHDTLHAKYEWDKTEQEALRMDIVGLKACLKTLRCIPLAVIETEAGSSIHYAGTVPFRAPDFGAPVTCDPSGKLASHDRVYIGDSSSWTHLPAKGLTFTLMANARRVASEAARRVHEDTVGRQ